MNRNGILITLALVLTFSTVKAQAVDLKFNWGESTGQVIETIEKNNKVSRTTYQIDFLPQNDDYVLKYSNFKILLIDGEPLTPQMEEALQASGVAQMVPSLLISASGEPKDIVDFEGFMRNLGKLMGSKFSDKLTQNSKMKKALFLKSFDMWCSWSCPWANQTFETKETKVQVAQVDAFGFLLPQESTLTYLGELENGKYGRINYIAETSSKGVDLSEIEKTISEFSISQGKSKKINTMEGRVFSKTTTIDAVVELKTLRPIDITVLSISTVIEPSGAIEKTKVEKHRYQFKWR